MAVPSFTTDQWLIVGLIFLLGIVVGMFLTAGGKWKSRYREEAGRCEALEAENTKLRADAQEMDSLRHAAARDEAARREAAAIRADEPLRAEPPVRAEPLLREKPRLRDEPPPRDVPPLGEEPPLRDPDPAL
jgi:outer membrane murein-binding lipoprotein Lpp